MRAVIHKVGGDGPLEQCQGGKAQNSMLTALYPHGTHHNEQIKIESGGADIKDVQQSHMQS